MFCLAQPMDPSQEWVQCTVYQLTAAAMDKNINSVTRAIIKIIKAIQIVKIIKIINYVSIQLTYINFIRLYSTNFCNKNKALNNLAHSLAILMMGTMTEIDE